MLISTHSSAIRDSATMLRRNLLHVLRYPGMTVGVLMVPVLMLLLFRYAFGATLAAGIRGTAHGGYINYLAPGAVVLAVSSASVSTAVAVSMDTTEGIINRFRTMAIARVSVLTGHVLGSVIQTVAAAAVVTGLAVALGFRPAARNPEGASNTPMPLIFLPFLGSAFVPPQSMAPRLRWFAQYQPFTRSSTPCAACCSARRPETRR